MKENFAKILLSISLLAALPSSLSADTSKLAILPEEPLTILPGELSGQLTVQSQDESGAAKTAEKIILTFESSSPTGEFFTASGNSLASYRYISANTSNRNFAYKDSSEGTFTITVTGVGESTDVMWVATKEITVSASGNNDGAASGEVLGASSVPPPEMQPPAAASTKAFSSSPQLEVVASGDRAISVGSPARFRADVKKNSASLGLEFSWSFGDGNVGSGPIEDHIYRFPGTYVVVLSAFAGDAFSISRFNIKVTGAEIAVSDQGGYLKISNNGESEVNLFNWKIESAGKAFMFQPNTIILPRSSLLLDKSLLNMKGSGISQGLSLKNYLGEEVFSSPANQSADLPAAYKNLESAKKELLSVQQKTKALGSVGIALSDKKQAPQTAAVLALVSDPSPFEEQVSGQAAEKVIYEEAKGESFLAKTWNFIKGMLR